MCYKTGNLFAIPLGSKPTCLRGSAGSVSEFTIFLFLVSPCRFPAACALCAGISCPQWPQTRKSAGVALQHFAHGFDSLSRKGLGATLHVQVPFHGMASMTKKSYTLFGPLCISSGHGSFSWTLPEFFRICSHVSRTCPPSCWTRPRSRECSVPLLVTHWVSCLLPILSLQKGCPHLKKISLNLCTRDLDLVAISFQEISI